MLTSIIVRIINFCTRHAWSVIAAGILLSIVSGLFAAKHFAINSEINTLLSAELPWRKREVAFEKAFSRFESIIVVVNAPTAELAGLATTELTAELEKHTDRFKTVSQLGGGEFFARAWFALRRRVVPFDLPIALGLALAGQFARFYQSPFAAGLTRTMMALGAMMRRTACATWWHRKPARSPSGSCGVYEHGVERSTTFRAVWCA